MGITWKCADDVVKILTKIKDKHHPHLTKATFGVAFNESKPFIKDRFNWGKISKFSDFNQIWQAPQKFDFSIVICSEVWVNILNDHQREALLDLHLCRCEVEYEPEIIIEGKKKIKVKDDLGRTKYTTTMKLDDNGNPKWRVAPLDLDVLSKNVKHYGLWLQEFLDLKSVIVTAPVTNS